MQPPSHRLLPSFLSFVFAMALFSAATKPASAQQDQTPKRGFQAGGSYALSDIETINTGSGNVILNIPMASLAAGRGTAPGSTLRLLYNSKMFDSRVEHHSGLPEGGGDCISPTGVPIPCDESRTNRDSNGKYINAGWHENSAFLPQDNSYHYSMNVLQASDEGGWRYGLGYKLQFFKREDEYVAPSMPDCPADEAVYIFKLKIAFPDGGVHEFRPTGYGQSSTLNDGYYRINYDGWFRDCANIGYYAVTTGMTYYSTDGSYLRLFIAHDGDNNPFNNAWTLYMPDGSRVTGGSGPQRVYDRNNNYTEIQLVTLSDGHTAHKVVDQLGRYFLVEYGAAPNEDNVIMYGFAGEEIRWRIKWKSIWVHKNYISTDDLLPLGISRIKEVMTQFSVVDQVILPAQVGTLAYSFNYAGSATQPPWGSYTNGWGEVKAVTLPTGAQSSYQYNMEEGTASYADVLSNSPIRKDLSYQKEYDNDTGVSQDTWLYSFSISSNGSASFITNPDGGVSKEYSLQTGQSYKSESPDGTVVERIWKPNYPTLAYPKTEFTSIRDAAGNLARTAIKDYNYDKNGNVTAVREYDWVDYASVPRDSGGDPTGLPGGLTPKRVTTNTYYNPTPDASDFNTYDPDSYYLATSPPIRNAIATNELSNGSLILSRTEFFYDSATTSGNLTQQKWWDSTRGGYSNPLGAGNSVALSHQYDSYGNRLLSTDPRGAQTQFVYNSVGGFTALYPTETRAALGTNMQRTTAQEYDFNTGLVTRAIDVDNNASTSTLYDAFGRPTLVRTAENKPEETRTATEYSDVNRRVIVRADLNTVGDGKLVSVQHYDRLGRVRLTRQLEDATTQSPTDETTGIKVQARYTFSGANSYQLGSNPYRAANVAAAASEATMGWLRTKSDSGGRVIEVQSFGGNSLPAPWGSNSTSTGTVVTAYNAEITTVTDQDSKVRRSVIDGLGRLGSIVEDPGVLNYLTNYSYDALDGLTGVSQGVQTRTFAYDSLKRLSSATSPESGTINYQYDSNGNLVVKTDVRSVSAHYSYDSLSRLTRRWYNGSNSQTATTNNNPALTSGVGASDEATYSYDSANIANGKGRLASVSSSGSTYTYNAYDAMGRAKSVTQTLGSQNYPLSYVSDLAGHVKSITYPSGRIVSYTPDAAGRLQSFTGNLGDGTQRAYASGIIYSPMGGLSQEQFGTTTPIFNKLFYNSRGQLAEIREGVTPNDTNWERGAIINHYSNQCWGMCWANGLASVMSDNNGNLKKQEVYVPGAANFAQFYEYDRLNRLESVRENRANGPVNWQQAYIYDRYGNRSISQAGTTPGVGINNIQAAVTPNTTTNRLYAPGETEQNHPLMNYDGAGNQTKDYYADSASGMSHDHTYDAENRLRSSTTTYASPASTQSSSYSYDADGRRVRRNINGVETWQVYGPAGELLAEYAANTPATSPQKEYGYRNGQLLITATAAAGERVNFARANGSYPFATASSSFNLSFTPNAANNGDRKGLHWGYGPLTGNGWQDVTASTYPDWLQIDFNTSRTIDEIDVFTIQDNWSDPVEPSESMTFTTQGLTSFDVQYWNGMTWVTVPGGSISGNNKVWRKLTFAAITTSKIRIVANAALANYSRIVEVEAWGTAGGTPVDLKWLVTDQLGTPRMIFDQTGSLVTTRRHDYLPFGEELLAGGRSATLGYSTVDGVRQKFTDKERDSETGLDYFLARYYSATQGRFTSSDEFPGGAVEAFTTAASDNPTFYAELTNPQTLNKYQYCFNNPLRYTDPNGHQGAGSSLKQWYESLVRMILRRKDPAEEAEQERRGPLSPDKDRVVETTNEAIGRQAEAYKNAIQTTGMDFGAIDVAEKAMKEDYKGAAIAGVIFVANAGTLGRGEQAVVIGENMAERVIPAAEQVGARAYRPLGRVTVASCAQFVSRAVKSGKRVFDVGIEGYEAHSEYYAAEFARLSKLGFARVERATVELQGRTVKVYEWVRKAGN